MRALIDNTPKETTFPAKSFFRFANLPTTGEWISAKPGCCCETQWVHLDLNQEPRDYESPALTVELWTRVFHLVTLNQRTQTTAISLNRA